MPEISPFSFNGTFTAPMRRTSIRSASAVACPILSLTLYLGVSIVSSKDASAAFSQLICPRAYTTAINFRIDGYQYDLKENDYSQYQDNQTTPWTEIITNSNVSGIYPNLSYFWVETNYDYFQFNDATGYPKYTGYLNSNYTTVPAPVPLQTISHTGYRDIWYQWFSDYSVHYTAPIIHTGTVSCDRSQTTTATNSRNFGSTGTTVEMLLIGTGDTVYATFSQPANSTGLVILTHKVVGGDADLYLSSTTSTPDDSSFTYRSWAAGDDAIPLPLTTTQKTWFVGVHSFSASEHVVLDVKFQKSSASIPMKVSTEFTPSGDQQQQIRQFLQSGALRMLSATDGAMRLGPFDVYPKPGVNCETDSNWGICLSDADTWHADAYSANNCKNADAVFYGPVWQGNWNLFFVHEMGHGCFNFAEEYDYDLPPVVELCGHSQMNSSAGELVNTATAGYCSRRHCYDGDGTNTSICNPNAISNWTFLKQQTSIPLTWASNWAAGNMDPRRTNYTNNAALAGLVSVNFH